MKKAWLICSVFVLSAGSSHWQRASHTTCRSRMYPTRVRLRAWKCSYSRTKEKSLDCMR